MRISDGSSDGCSSDLGSSPHAAPLAAHRAGARGRDGRAQFRTAPTFHAAPFGKKRTDVRLDHHVQFEVRHRRDLGFAITLPFDIATRTYLALVNDQSAVTKHIDVGQQIARVDGTFASTPIADRKSTSMKSSH